MQRLSLIDRLEIYLAAAYFDLLVASLARVERFPCSFGFAELVERYTVAVRWRAESGLAGHLDCSVDNCPPPGPDPLTTNFAESPRLSAWLEGVAELAAVPLSPACMFREKPDSDPVS